MANKEYERVGSGSYDVYRAKKKAAFWDQVGEVVGGLFLVGAALFILNAIFG